jgi:dihydroorotate dehydrogenase
MYEHLIKPLLFRLDAEDAHNLTFSGLKTVMSLPAGAAILGALAELEPDGKPVELFGLTFRNPIGLAAGMDKNAELLKAWAALGFGFVEVGTVTPRPQPGNPKPRMFRLPADTALINRLGFNNNGAAAMAKKLRHKPDRLVVGVNIGKNKDTPNETAVDDYLSCFEQLASLADYMVVNVSSPNTPGLRELQDKDALLQILSELQHRNYRRMRRVPLLLKIAPDLTAEQVDEVIEVVQRTALDGIVATNTTISRDGLKTPSSEVEALGAGGLSGAPLLNHANAVLQQVVKSGIPTIGVGGITDAASMRAKFAAGAKLVQVYSGYVYRGPALVGELQRALLSQ